MQAHSTAGTRSLPPLAIFKLLTAYWVPCCDNSLESKTKSGQQDSKIKEKAQFWTEEKSANAHQSCFHVQHVRTQKDLHANFYCFSPRPPAPPRWRRKKKETEAPLEKTLWLESAKLHCNICLESSHIITSHLIELHHIVAHFIAWLWCKVLYHVVL